MRARRRSATRKKPAWEVFAYFTQDVLLAAVGTPLLHGARDALEWRATYVDRRRNAISQRQVVGPNPVDPLRLRPAHRKRKDHAEKWFRPASTPSRLHEYHDAGATYPS